MKRLKLVKRIRQADWPRIARAGREPAVFVVDLTYAEREMLRGHVPYSGASDTYVATYGRELDRVLAMLCGPHFAHRRSATIRLEWPERPCAARPTRKARE